MRVCWIKFSIAVLSFISYKFSLIFPFPDTTSHSWSPASGFRKTSFWGRECSSGSTTGREEAWHEVTRESLRSSLPKSKRSSSDLSTAGEGGGLPQPPSQSGRVLLSPQTEHLKKGHELLVYVTLTVLGVVHRLRGITAGSRNQSLEPGLTAPGFPFLFSFTQLPVTLSLRSLSLWKGFSRVLGRCGLTPQGWKSTTWTELRFSNGLLKEKPLLVFRGSHDHPWATYHILRSEWGTLIGQALLAFP